MNLEPATFVVDSKDDAYECPRFKVEEYVYTNEGEQRKTFTIRPPNDFLIVIPRLEKQLLLVKTTNPPNPYIQWTFPTGFVVPGVAIADTAQTILLENSGTVAQRFIYAGKFYPSKYLNAVAHVMIGEGLHRFKDRNQNFTDKVQLLTEEGVAELLTNRVLIDGLTLASYVYYVTSQHYWVEVHKGARDSR
jgi:hypothetical protein